MKESIIKKVSILALLLTCMSPAIASMGNMRGCTLSLQTVQQDVKITGTVTDGNADPIIGANIRVKATSIGVISDLVKTMKHSMRS